MSAAQLTDRTQAADQQAARASAGRPTGRPGTATPSTAGVHLELHGLGKGVWEKVDVEKYISDLRDDWDHR